MSIEQVVIALAVAALAVALYGLKMIKDIKDAPPVQLPAPPAPVIDAYTKNEIEEKLAFVAGEIEHVRGRAYELQARVLALE